MIWTSGDDCGAKYIGNWLNDRFNGEGYYSYANNDSYEGMFKNGQMDGFGLFKSAIEQSTYKGYWKNNLKNGKGIEKTSNAEYVGSFLMGKKHGKNGKYSFMDGSEYIGDFNEDQFVE